MRDEYREALENGATDSDAEAAVLRQFAEELADPDERVVVWLALAFTESKFGRLSSEAHCQALAILDAGGDLDRWQQAGVEAVRRRAAALQKVRIQLEGRQPAPPKIRRRSRPKSSLAVGQVLAYRSGSGRLHLMRVAALIDMGGCVQPAIRFMDYADTQLPEPEQLLTIRDRRRHPKWKKTELRVFDDSPQQREQAGLTLVGSVPEPQFPEVPDPKAACAWAEVVTYLETRDQLIDR
ncbi:MAG TPA: hypothetical protein VFX61_15865 [Micromonosporaceae bacterium]|nr:hypothetical protein [Micromonosporaceae bacterium]